MARRLLRRSFSRLSRRQSATPDIPRAVWVRPAESLATRTFGVVLDTSGSMGPRLLGMGLGAVASYALSREVPAVRLVQCDAGVHDMGFVEPEGAAAAPCCNRRSACSKGTRAFRATPRSWW